LYPDSLTLSKDVLYVLNAGGPGQDPACSGTNPNISGFRVDVYGNLKPLADSLRAINPGPLDGTGYFLNCDPGGFAVPTFDCGLNPPAFPRSPGEVKFTPAGNQLVVTVKSINTIYVFPVNKNSTLGTPTLTQAAGPNQPTYFGFAFDQAGHMIVAEPFGGSPTIPHANAATVSSFGIASNGDLTVISGSIANGQTATCWIAIDPTSQYAYTTNNGSGTISSYSIASNGSLALLAATAATVNRPNDMAVARQVDGSSHISFLYSLDAGDGTVGEFQINGDGSLTSLGTVTGLPAGAGAQGLAAY
jgi:6-phosphogluconolactonase